MLSCSRREWLIAATACAVAPKLHAGDLSGFYYRDYSKCLPDYLSMLARALTKSGTHNSRC